MAPENGHESNRAAGADAMPIPDGTNTSPQRATKGTVMVRAGRWIGGIAFSIVLLFGAAAVVWFGLKPSTRQAIIANFTIDQSDEVAAWRSTGGQELTSATAQHFFIALPISKCFPRADISKDDVPGHVFATLMIGLRPSGNHEWSDRGDVKNISDFQIKLTNYQGAIIFLSDAISRSRKQLAEAVADNRSRSEMYQWTLIIFGAITTILISIKSMSSDKTPIFVTVGVLAIIFSALGTACSSINSFYSPAEAVGRSERALLQARQLHTDLGIAVTSSPNLCDPIKSASPDDPRLKSIKDFSTRLADIVSGSGSAGPTTPNGAAPAGSTTGTTTHR